MTESLRQKAQSAGLLVLHDVKQYGYFTIQGDCRELQAFADLVKAEALAQQEEQHDYDRGWKEGYKHGAWSAAPAAQQGEQQPVAWKYQERGQEWITDDLHEAQRENDGVITPLYAGAAPAAHECTRSHPHELMDGYCQLRTEIARLTNENARLKTPWLLKTTQDLAIGIAKRCYPEVTQFEVLDDLAGVISQIDNMTTGMERKTAPVAQPVAGWKLVPVEPTQAMCAAAVKFANGDAVYKNVAAEALEIEEGIYGEAYRAMLVAAPAAQPIMETYIKEDKTQPLTDEQILHCGKEVGMADSIGFMEALELGVKYAERHHGIGVQK